MSRMVMVIVVMFSVIGFETFGQEKEMTDKVKLKNKNQIFHTKVLAIKDGKVIFYTSKGKLKISISKIEEIRFDAKTSKSNKNKKLSGNNLQAWKLARRAMRHQSRTWDAGKIAIFPYRKFMKKSDIGDRIFAAAHIIGPDDSTPNYIKTFKIEITEFKNKFKIGNIEEIGDFRNAIDGSGWYSLMDENLEDWPMKLMTETVGLNYKKLLKEVR